MHVHRYMCSLMQAYVTGVPWFGCKWQWLVFIVIFISCVSACIVSLPCVAFFHFIVQWTVPTITGDIPPPLANFSFTKISSNQGAMFGGHGARDYSSDLRIATVSRDSVVSVSIALNSTDALLVCLLATYSVLSAC